MLNTIGTTGMHCLNMSTLRAVWNLGRCSITVHYFHSGRFQVLGTFLVQLYRLSFAKIVCFLFSYLVGLISRYGIDVFKSRFNICNNYKLRDTAKRESNLI